jgi:hypothetical protein
MKDWHLFANPQSAFQFKYPLVARNGEAIKHMETQKEGMLRVHILALDNLEVYFEVTQNELLMAESEYQRHKEHLRNQFMSLRINELRKTLFKSLPAYEYHFAWDQGKRKVILVEREEATYRILYDPRSPVNLQIVSTLKWLIPP